MAFHPVEGFTCIRVVFEQHNGAYRAHTINYSFKNESDRTAIEDSTLLNIRRCVLEDFRDSVMYWLGQNGLTGACVSFAPVERTEYAAPVYVPPFKAETPEFMPA